MKAQSLFLFLIFLFLIQFTYGQAIIQTDSMMVPRVFHEMQALPDGRILVFGGLNNEGAGPGIPGPVGACEIYDPTTASWSMTDSLETPRYDMASVVTNDGKILAIAGFGINGLVKEIEEFDPVTETWSELVDFTFVGGDECVAIRLDSDEIFVGCQANNYLGSADGLMWSGL